MGQRIALIIRCFNEEAHIGRLLTGTARQTRVPDEIIVVDSGSTDATLAIASTFDVDIVSLSREDFSFGHALNLGIARTTSDICLLASAHVYPLFDSWVERLVAPFADPKVALTYGRQQTPPGGRFSEQRLMAQWFPSDSVNRQHHPFCNNANAAIKRSVWEDQPYDEQLTGLEDLDWARKAMSAGHAVAYVSEAPVIHVHNESFAQVVNRYRREAIAHKQIYNEQSMSVWTATRLAVANVSGDLVAARRDGVLRDHALGIPRFRIAQFLGIYQGFSQSGPVTEALRRRFYYPSSARESRALDATDAVGRPIDYDEPVQAR